MKRIVCFLLALIMVLGLIPNTVVTANAAKRDFSANAVDILRASVNYYDEKTEVGGKKLIGYSHVLTTAEETKYPNGISTEKAVALLKEDMKSHNDIVNAFAETYVLNLSTTQHDALVIRSYRGTFTSELKTAISTGKTGNEMLNAFAKAHGATEGCFNITTSGSIGEDVEAKMNTAMCEAGLFMNGSYSKGSFSYAVLDKNGNEKIDSGDQAAIYVTSKGYNLDPAGILGWYVYDGTVDGKINGSAITKLTGDHSGKLIVAKQGSGNVFANYTINTSTLSSLKTYTANLVTYVDTLMYNTIFTVTEEFLYGTDKWACGKGTNEKGVLIENVWVNLGTSTKEEESPQKPIATAELKSTVYIFPGASSEGVAVPGGTLGTIAAGNVVNIYEIKVENTAGNGNKNWGKVNVGGVIGWINLAYATVEETLGESGEAKGQTGVITNTDEVNVRTDAGTDKNLIGALKRGTKVTILDTKMVGTAQWGLAKWNSSLNGYTQGWIYMYYIQLDNAPEIDTGSGSTTAGTVKYTGVVTSNINLNVRRYPDIYAAKVDSLPFGTKINVYETASSRNMKWGRIGENRWICLTYVNLTEVAQPEGGAGTGSSTSTSVQGTVKPATLDVYKNYNANSQKVGTLKKGDVVTILERNTENTSSGTRIWGRIKVGEMEGWINLAYAEVKTVTSVTGGTTSGSTSGAASNAGGAAGTVANCISVNVRSAAGVSNAQITKLNNGTSVKVFERVTKDGAPWARITWNNGANEGWVCMNYVTMNTQAGGTAADGTVGGTNSNTISATGIVNSNIDLKVRSGAGLGNAQIGALKKGTKVTVYEQVSADGMIWGRTPYGAGSGWICMSYVTIESTTSTGKGVMGTVARCFAAVNVRSAPGTNNALINKINVGSRVEVFETKQHGTQLWGRVAQGWVCMDYILLDSELPPGTVLDATVPTTEATQPGETTEPDDGLDLTGAVSCSIKGKVGSAADLDIHNDADKDSTKVGTIAKNSDITIVGVKMNGSDAWGVINQNGTQGWIKLTENACTFSGWVNTDKQPIYATASTSGSVVDKLSINYHVDNKITKLAASGSEVFGYISDKGGWIPVSKLVSKALDIVKVYDSSATYTGSMDATTNIEVSARKAIDDSEIVFKIASDANIKVEKLVFVEGKIWAKVIAKDSTDIDAKVGYIEFASTRYELSVATVASVEVRKTPDNSIATDAENTNFVKELPSGTGALKIRMMQFDAKGNTWAQIVSTDPELNLNYIIIRNHNGTANVSGINGLG